MRRYCFPIFLPYLTPWVWADTVQSIRDCNANAGASDAPDMVSFVGWEWSNSAKDDVPSHYGHKNVIFRTWEEAQTPTRPIASGPGYRFANIPAPLRGLLGFTDGIGNACDTDDDGDGVPDSSDTFPLDPSETTDTDGDGVSDILDVFPNNPDESRDTDKDGTGNNADTDDDNDGVADADDDFPLDSTETVDTDKDGIGNNADTDDDNDSVLDTNDVFPLTSSEWVDADQDGTGDACDSDDDPGDHMEDWLANQYWFDGTGMVVFLSVAVAIPAHVAT